MTAPKPHRRHGRAGLALVARRGRGLALAGALLRAPDGDLAGCRVARARARVGAGRAAV